VAAAKVLFCEATVPKTLVRQGLQARGGRRNRLLQGPPRLAARRQGVGGPGKGWAVARARPGPAPPAGGASSTRLPPESPPRHPPVAFGAGAGAPCRSPCPRFPCPAPPAPGLPAPASLPQASLPRPPCPRPPCPGLPAPASLPRPPCPSPPARPPCPQRSTRRSLRGPLRARGPRARAPGPSGPPVRCRRWSPAPSGNTGRPGAARSPDTARPAIPTSGRRPRWRR